MVMGSCCCKKKFGHHGHHHGGFIDTSKTLDEMRDEIIAHNKTHAVHQVLDHADFEEQLKLAGSKLVVIDFFATWCGPCKVMGPEFEKMAAATPDVLFLKVDVDHLEELATEYNVTVMPTFVVIVEGKRVGDMSGANPQKLKAFIDEKNMLGREQVQIASNNQPAQATPAN